MSDIIEENDEIRISAPKLLPFTHCAEFACPACGSSVTPRLLQLWLMLTMGMRPQVFDPHYCSGGKVPVEEVTNPLARAMGQEEHRWPCGGIDRPHLHLTCKDCQYQVIMELKS
jgi:hypothetical protein